MERFILIILVLIQGVWSADWKVTLKSQCALKGTSVVIKCEYDYPAGHIVTKVIWTKAQFVSGKWGLLPLSELPSPTDHFTYEGNYWSDCSLRINNVQPTDEGQYFFSFVTTIGRWTSRTYAYLSVKELITVVRPSTVTEGNGVSLTCVSDCPTPVDIVWFRNGQPVRNSVFQARRQDAGWYYCAILGQKTVRSVSAPLNVQYAPEKVTLSMSPSGNVVRGGSVTFSCSSDARPPVTQSGYSLFKDGHFISSGQYHTISDIQPSHSGLYHCQASNNVSSRSIMKPTGVHLNVQYRPMNISILMNPLHVVTGSSVNLTCSGDANPAADTYTWYRKTAAPSSMLPVGSGQLLSIPAVNASHTGLYLCQARNRLGEDHSAEVLLAVKEKEHGSQSLPILAGIGVSLLVTFVLALLLLWRKQRIHNEKKQAVFDYRLSSRGSSSSAAEDQSSNVYMNVHMLPSSPPPVTDRTPHAERSTLCEHDAPASHADEVTYSAVTIKPRSPSLPHHRDTSRAPQSKAGTNYNSVIYATVAESS